MIIETVEDLIEALESLDPKMKVRVDHPTLRTSDESDMSEIDSVETDREYGRVVIKV